MDIIERLKIAEETKKDVIGFGDFMKGTSVIQEAIYEITSLRQQLAEQTSGENLWGNSTGAFENVVMQKLPPLTMRGTSHVICQCDQCKAAPSVEVLLEALRDIAKVNHNSAKCGQIANDALNAYSSKPQTPVSVNTDSDSN
jgi:hypothetical protein